MPSGLFCHYMLDESIVIKGLSCLFIFSLFSREIIFSHAISEVPDQMPRLAASDLDYTVGHCLLYETLGLN